MIKEIILETYNNYISCCRLDLLKRLVEHEPDSVNIPDMDGKNVLHIASASGATEFVKYLITTKVRH